MAPKGLWACWKLYAWWRADNSDTDSPYFLATKLEAFKGWGGGDGRLSHDFEDIVFVLENREKLWEELETSDDGVKAYLVAEFSALMDHPHIYEWIDSHVERGNIRPQTSTIIENIKNWLNKSMDS